MELITTSLELINPLLEEEKTEVFSGFIDNIVISENLRLIFRRFTNLGASFIDYDPTHDESLIFYEEFVQYFNTTIITDDEKKFIFYKLVMCESMEFVEIIFRNYGYAIAFNIDFFNTMRFLLISQYITKDINIIREMLNKNILPGTISITPQNITEFKNLGILDKIFEVNSFGVDLQQYKSVVVIVLLKDEEIENIIEEKRRFFQDIEVFNTFKMNAKAFAQTIRFYYKQFLNNKLSDFIINNF